MNLGEYREINDKWEISGESCLGGQVIAFGLGIGICFCIKGAAWHVKYNVEMQNITCLIFKGSLRCEKNKYDFDIVICGLFDGLFLPMPG